MKTLNNVVPAAGARTDKVQGSGLMGGPGSVTDCLTFAARPGTPPEIKKYRRTSALTPGARYQHYGIADDLSKMNLGERVYGGSSAKGAESAGELVNSQLPTEMQRITMEKAEGIYKERAKEPLGRTVDRGIVLPSKFTVGKTPFGCVGKSDSEKAKDVIFPDVSEEQIEGEEIYRRSHGFSYPGEQKNRDYKWYVDPVTTRFGVKGDTIALNGVSKNIADVLKGAGDTPSVINIKKVEDYRNMGDVLGQSKNLGQGSAARPFDTVYGKASASSRKSGNVWGAAQTIQGKYTVDQQLPDFDLGKSITPGFRNISLEDRAYGCPSIRTDLPRMDAQRRSLADSQNYGDDVPAQDLINPPAFSDLSIEPMVMTQHRNQQQMLSLFERIGQQIDADVGAAIFAEASRGYSTASINDFRSCLVLYLDAVKNRDDAGWRRAHGL